MSELCGVATSKKMRPLLLLSHKEHSELHLSPQSSPDNGAIVTFPKSSKPPPACLVRDKISPASVKDRLGSGTHLRHLRSPSRNQRPMSLTCCQYVRLPMIHALRRFSSRPVGWRWHLGWHLFATRVKFPHSFCSLRSMACAFQGSLPTEIC